VRFARGVFGCNLAHGVGSPCRKVIYLKQGFDDIRGFRMGAHTCHMNRKESSAILAVYDAPVLRMYHVRNLLNCNGRLSEL
jgi:hypothetical protein